MDGREKAESRCIELYADTNRKTLAEMCMHMYADSCGVNKEMLNTWIVQTKA